MTRSGLRYPIADSERERRWAGLRSAMKQTGPAALVMHGPDDWLGGHMRGFIRLRVTNCHPRAITFFENAPMSAVEMAERPLIRAKENNALARRHLPCGASRLRRRRSRDYLRQIDGRHQGARSVPAPIPTQIFEIE